MDLDFVLVHKNAKKELGQYPAILTEQAWSITHIDHISWRFFVDVIISNLVNVDTNSIAKECNKQEVKYKKVMKPA